MRYLPNTPAQQREMLDAIGVASLDDLWTAVPPDARLSAPLAVPPAEDEGTLLTRLQELAGQNASTDLWTCFLGGGSYDHAVPSAVRHLVSRGEFFTAYTPYQPEASQGTLRAIFEYQTMVAELTGMEVANASLYDGASALAEGVLTAHTATGRGEVALSAGVNPLHVHLIPRYAGDGGGGIQSLIRSSVKEDLASVAGQIRSAAG